MKKNSKFALVATIIFACYSELGEAGVLTPSIIDTINNQVGTGVNISALEKVISDLGLINTSTIQPNKIPGSSYSLNSISGLVNGHNVTIFTTDGLALGNLAVSGINNTSGLSLSTQQLSFINKITSSPENVVLQVDGVTVLNGSTVNRANVIDLARMLNILSFIEGASSTSLASISPSSLSSQIAFDKLNVNVLSHKQRQAMMKQPLSGFNFAMGDLKYEQAQFTNNNERGDIKGGTMSLSTQVYGVELGAKIPYDYLSFTSFSAQRTGAVIYAKRDWQLPYNLQLTAMTNFNYMATYVTQLSLTNTFGGGVGTSLSYDNGGNFIPRVSISLQYNQDDYAKANNLMIDNHQYLIKTGASLGYRLFENGTLNAGVVYNRDVTDYTSIYNQQKDNDYFDLTAGGSYSIANTWQVNLNYKRILGLNNYYSNAVYLGSSFGF